MSLPQDSGAVMGAGTQILAGHFLVVLFVSVLQTCSAAGDSNLTLLALPEIVGVWNRSKYPASQFRDESIERYFDIWPENATEVEFVYYCEDLRKGNLSLSNFTYGPTEGQLDPRPYYDLGVTDSYQPYWKHWTFWNVDTKRISYPINCEYHDLHGLYVYRFWHMPMLHGFLSYLVLQGVVMFTVFITMTLRGRGKEMETEVQGKVECWFRPWSRDWGHFFSELIHLGLVAEVGSCMIEVIGHSDLRSWCATIMFNTGVVYTWLSLFSVLASILRQITNGWKKKKDYDDLRNGNTPTIGREKLFALQNISDDWRWQRVFGQLGTLVLVGTFLTSVDNASGSALDQMAAMLLAAAVVACIWSYGVTAVCLFRSVFLVGYQSAKIIMLFWKDPKPDGPH